MTFRMWVQHGFIQTHCDTLFVLYFLLEFKFKVTWMDRNAPVPKCQGVSMQTGSVIIV